MHLPGPNMAEETVETIERKSGLLALASLVRVSLTEINPRTTPRYHPRPLRNQRADLRLPRPRDL